MQRIRCIYPWLRPLQPEGKSLYLPQNSSHPVDRMRIGFSLVPPAVAALVGPPIAGSILGPDYVWWKGITFASVSLPDAS